MPFCGPDAVVMAKLVRDSRQKPRLLTGGNEIKSEKGPQAAFLPFTRAAIA
jgi:hypothetical protein